MSTVSSNQYKTYRMKSEYSADNMTDIDVGDLPRLVLSNEALRLTQELIQTPGNIDLINRLTRATFSDPPAAHQALAKATVEALALEDGYLYESDQEKFSQVPGELLEFFFEEEGFSDHDINESVHSQDLADDLFEDEDITPKKSSPPKNTITRDLEATVNNALLQVATCNQVDDLRKIILQQGAEIIELKKSVNNIAQMMADVVASISELNRRLELRVNTAPAPKGTPMPAPRPMEDFKTNIHENNYKMILKLLVQAKVYTPSDTTNDLITGTLTATKAKDVKQFGEPLGLGFTDCEAEYISRCTFHSSAECKKVVATLSEACKRGITTQIPHGQAHQPIVVNPSTTTTPDISMHKFNDRTR